MQKTLTLLILAILCLSCSSEEGKPIIPTNITLDANEDGEVDFDIQFNEVNLEFTFKEDDPDSRIFDRAIYCVLSPKNENSTFVELRSPVSFSLPTLTQNDTVRVLNPNPFDWKNFPTSNISEIKRITNTKEWQQEWSFLIGDKSSENQFIALRIESNGSSTLCWIEIEISAIDGSVSILNQNCADDDNLIIGQ